MKEKIPNYVYTQGGWKFELKHFLGKKYDKETGDTVGVVTVQLANGSPYIDGLICHNLEDSDIRDISLFVTHDLGFKNYSELITDIPTNKNGHIFKRGLWDFEVRSLFGRKFNEWGGEYYGITTFNIAGGEIYAEGLHCDKFTGSDYKSMTKFARNILGFESYEYSRFKSPTSTRIVSRGKDQ